MKLKTPIIYLCALSIFITSCKSTTTIYSTSPGADVYIGKKYKGKTPYVHKDYLPTGFSRKVEVRKEGYQPQTGKIRKLGTINGMAIYCSLIAIVPILWVGGYDRMYQFDLIKNGSSVPEKSDFLKMGEAFKTTKGGSTVYVGSEGNNHYIYKSGELHTLNNDLSWSSSTELAKNNRLIAIDGYINGNVKRIVELDNTEKSISILSVNNNGSVTTKTIKDILYRDKIQVDEFSYGYRRSSETNHFICYSQKGISLYDENLSLLNSYQSENNIIEAYVLPDDVVISLEIKSNTVYLCVRDGDSETYHEVDIDREHQNNYFRLNVNVENVKLYISSIYGDTKKDNFYPKGTQVLTYNLVDLSLYNKKIEPFGEEVTKSSKSKYLINKGIISDGDKAYQNLEEQWTVVTTSSDGGGSVAHYSGKLVVIDASKDANNEFVFNKYVKTTVNADKISFQVQLKDNQLFYVFNSQLKGRPATNQVILNEELQPITWHTKDMYKETKTLYRPLYGYDMKDGKRMYIHQYKKRLGVAVSEF